MTIACPHCRGSGRLGDPRCDNDDHALVLVAIARGVPPEDGDESVTNPALRDIVGTGGTWTRAYQCRRPYCPETRYQVEPGGPVLRYADLPPSRFGIGIAP